MSVIMKFGGTSVGTAQNIAHVTSIVAARKSTKPVVIVSALSKVTDMLIELAHKASRGKGNDVLKKITKRHEEVLNDLGLPASVCADVMHELNTLVKKTQKRGKIDEKSLDYFQSFGERLCARITAAALERAGTPSKAFDAWELGMITTNRFGNAEPLPSSYLTLKKKIFALDVVPVITGFIGKTKKGEPTTLGRGGSDFAAAIIGAAIAAEKIQIWKEVDGFLTTDPRLVPEARLIPELAFEEASELAYFGAKVLHPKTILPAMKAGIPVQVLNTFKPEEPGTLIVSNFTARKQVSHTIDALTFKKGISLVRLYSPDFYDGNRLVADVFDLFGDHDVNIGDVALSVASTSLVLDSARQLPRALLAQLKKIGDVTVEKNKAMVCAVGGSKNTAVVAGRIFTLLGEHEIPVEFIAQASSGYSITFIVDDVNAERAISILHKGLIG